MVHTLIGATGEVSLHHVGEGPLRLVSVVVADGPQLGEVGGIPVGANDGVCDACVGVVAQLIHDDISFIEGTLRPALLTVAHHTAA